VYKLQFASLEVKFAGYVKVELGTSASLEGGIISFMSLLET